MDDKAATRKKSGIYDRCSPEVSEAIRALARANDRTPQQEAGRILRRYMGWLDASDEQIAGFQLFEDRLCCEFAVFHKAVEACLGRPVWTHEFADMDRLRKEFRGETPRATLSDILGLIPEEKRIVIVADEEEAGG